MKRKPDGHMERIAGAIVDETPIDWDAELSAAPDGRSRLRHLQAIHRMALAYRAVESPPSRDDRREHVSPRQPPLFEWGHLHVLEKLGEGSYGEVYRAFDPRLACEVALKLWRRPGGNEGLADEGRRLAKIRHRNVLTVHGAGEHDGRVGIWTDVIRGRTLEARLLAEGNLSAYEAASIGVDLCGALAAVHAAGLVHGDVKTTNVIREDGGRIVLLDFGSGGEPPSDTSPTPQDGPLGTPVALSPERLRGGPPDASSDLYALGVLLYRLVSGRYPVTARTIEELRSKHDRRERRPLRDARPDLPAAFVRVVERTLAHDAADRFASAGELEQALAASIEVGAREDRTPRLAVAGDRPRRTVRRLLGLGAALAVLVPAVVLVSGRGRSPIGPAGTEGAPLEVDAALYRLDGGTERPVFNGGGVGPGDRLHLELQSGEAVHVYVLNEDRSGDCFVLFPVPDLDAGNPLAAGVRHRLPGRLDGVPQDWTVTSAGGTETVLVICSRHPIPALESLLAEIPSAAPERDAIYAALDPESLKGLRGIGGLAPTASPDVAPAGRRLDGIADALARGTEGRGELWVREFRLHNP
jgi:hypothetical protein